MGLEKFTASGPALGYAYQIRYALLVALGRARSDPRDFVSVERLDDIAVETDGVPTVMGQTKHHTGAGADLGDKSADLWKTLRVWSEGVQSGVVPVPQTSLLLITNSFASPDTAAYLLRPEGRDIQRAHGLLLAAAESSKSEGLGPSFNAFCALSHSLQLALLSAVYVLDKQPNAVDLRAQIEREVQWVTTKARVKPLVDRLEGWWFDLVIEHMSGTSIPTIPVIRIDHFLDVLRREYREDSLPIEFGGAEPPDDQKRELLGKTFVEQLRLIGVKSPRMVDAVRDYYQAFAQRSKWVGESLLYLDDLASYEDRLRSEWRREYNAMMDEVDEGMDEADLQKMGRGLLHWMEQDARVHVVPECREPYVMRGSFHGLADRRHVGWHPNFIERLEAVLSEVPK